MSTSMVVGLATAVIFVLGLIFSSRMTGRQFMFWIMIVFLGCMVYFVTSCPNRLFWIGKIPFCK